MNELVYAWERAWFEHGMDMVPLNQYRNAPIELSHADYRDEPITWMVPA